MTRLILFVGKMIIIYHLGKLKYFTNLNLAAIWGWFPLYKNHDSRARENSEVIIIYPDIYTYIYIHTYNISFPYGWFHGKPINKNGWFKGTQTYIFDGHFPGNHKPGSLPTAGRGSLAPWQSPRPPAAVRWECPAPLILQRWSPGHKRKAARCSSLISYVYMY